MSKNNKLVNKFDHPYYDIKYEFKMSQEYIELQLQKKFLSKEEYNRIYKETYIAWKKDGKSEIKNKSRQDTQKRFKERHPDYAKNRPVVQRKEQKKYKLWKLMEDYED